MPVLVMGVCGSGKTSSGSALAALTGGRFLDADSLHTSESIAKMSNGIALTDADREPWLRRLAAELARDEDVVLACSALKARYRALLASMLTLRLPETKGTVLQDDLPPLDDREL